MKIALLGLGRIGLVYANELCHAAIECELVGFSPKRQDRFDHLLAHSHFRFSDDFSELESGTFDGYIIASPSTTHLEYLHHLIPKGKPIFCEKPVDLEEKNIKEVMELALRHQSKVLVGFNRRFDPQILNLKSQLANGAVGDVHILRLTSRDPGPPSLEFARHSGGLFLDMVIHDFDMIRFLTGAEPLTVFSKADLKIQPDFAEFDDVDTAISVVEMSNGTLVSIDNSRKAVYGYDQRIEAFGSQGMLQLQNQRHDETLYFDGRGRLQAPLKDFFMDRYLASYQAELAHFVQLIKHPDLEPAVTLHDALVATRIAVAARRSHQLQSEIKLDRS